MMIFQEGEVVGGQRLKEDRNKIAASKNCRV